MNDDLVEKVARALCWAFTEETDDCSSACLRAGKCMAEEVDKSFVRDARAAISAVEGEGWQPIDSAPKDETSIDVWVRWRDGGGHRVTDIWWNRDHWYDPDAEYGDGGPLVSEPTHWRPIPQPPVSKGEKM